ncbi:MAG: hypothetical protein MUE40_02840 [Anaerolineae bacterium]|jgi:hypothetical protein|nr:hypothetical protein [Anaerolineae bacterium]
MGSWWKGLAAALLWVGGLSLHEPIRLIFNDNLFYLDMALYGLSAPERLASPFAYRFLTPLLAGQLASLTGSTPAQAFYALALVGAVLQLLLVYALARRFGADDGAALVVQAVVALSFYQVRFLLADSLRPDHLAYPLMLVVMLLIFAGRRWPALLLALVGLNVREFFLIPPLLIGLLAYRDFSRRRDRGALLLLVTAFGSVWVVFLLQRLLIRVSSVAAYLEPLRTDFVAVLLATPLDVARLYNVGLAATGYLLPLLLLLTPARWRAIQAERRPLGLITGVYSLVVLLMTLYGGTDIPRFVTYLFIPQAVLLALLLRRGVPPLEVAYMLLVVALYNRLFFAMPQDGRAYLDFHTPYASVINAATWRFSLAIVVCLAGMLALRAILRRGAAARGRHPATP